MNWRRGGRISAVYGLFGTLALGGCAGGGDRADLASNADTSVAPAAREARIVPALNRDKLICKPLNDSVSASKTIGPAGDTILVSATIPPNDPVDVALLTVPAGAVNAPTRFVVRVPKGPRVVASVTAFQGTQPIDSFGPNGIQLTLHYDRRDCKLDNASHMPAQQVARLYGFKVIPQDEGKPDPAPMVSKGGKNDGSATVTLTLKTLSGYILAQGLVNDPTTEILPPDTTATPAL